MRIWTLAALLLAGCQQHQEQPRAKAAEMAFDGAQVTRAAARIAHGERISWALGCRGCHTPSLEGQRFYERYASNLTRDLAQYSDAEIERVLRTGVPHDDRDLWGMPSEIFQHLSAADMRALIADLRTLQPSGSPTQPPKPWEADAEDMITKGELKTAKDAVVQDKPKGPIDLGPTYALGRYVARITCAECHGPKLEGGPSGEPPNLIVAGGYTRAEFETLMVKGALPNNRKFKNPLMGEVARNRFSRLTAHERDELYAYLKARAERTRQ
jgi:cytochrome c553